MDPCTARAGGRMGSVYPHAVWDVQNYVDLDGPSGGSGRRVQCALALRKNASQMRLLRLKVRVASLNVPLRRVIASGCTGFLAAPFPSR